MTGISLLNSKAADDGIESYERVRQALISARNKALGPEVFDPEAAVFLSHIIWWLSALGEQIDD